MLLARSTGSNARVGSYISRYGVAVFVVFVVALIHGPTVVLGHSTGSVNPGVKYTVQAPPTLE